MDYERLTHVMRELALAGGTKIMEIYDRDDFEVKSKSDDSPVTEADEAADAIISAGLRAAFPDVALVTEEQAESHGQSAETFLIVDPLDGTKEFIHRRGDFTVNIAYVEAGVPTRGVVYAPARGRMFLTLADGRAVEEEGPFGAKMGRLEPVSVSEPDNGALLVVASKSHLTGRDQGLYRQVQRRRFQERGVEPEILPGRHRRGRSLSPRGPDDGMGHRRRSRGAGRGRGQGGSVRRSHAIALWQGGVRQPLFHRLVARGRPETRVTEGGPVPHPTISIVIASRERPESLLWCLKGIDGLDYPEFEVVVAACPAGAGALERAGLDSRVKLRRFDEANIAAARNAGIAAAGGEIVAFIDDDAVPEPTWLRHLATGLR